MTELTFNYRPVPEISKEKTLVAKHPDGFNELNSPQWIHLVKLYRKGKITFQDRVLFAFALLSIPGDLFVRTFDVEPAKLTDTDAELDEKFQRLENLNAVIKLSDFIKNDLIIENNLMPKVKVKSKKYYGPGDKFRNMTFAEFIFVDSYFLAYQANKDENTLNKMIAAMYRPQRKGYKPHSSAYGGDRREVFNEHILSYRAEEIGKMDLDYRMAIFWNYIGIRRWLCTQYPNVLPIHEDDPEAVKRNKKKLRTHNNWLKVVRSFTGGNPTEDDKVGKALLHAILDEMDQRIVESRKSKRKK
ncbi:hypothetical protein DF185_19945 [Marinifilum breve]|uniref:Uncharacterized protein n=1 Tax=Marinifilum breve TaxID=2184082 RepID=A0A2V3ZSU6_9BACT|nr:hypothetical protein [Marinifilum breve]PXX96915.1 hypothetical protein DF185_19945 [Marinifilum breve]